MFSASIYRQVATPGTVAVMGASGVCAHPWSVSLTDGVAGAALRDTLAYLDATAQPISAITAIEGTDVPAGLSEMRAGTVRAL